MQLFDFDNSTGIIANPLYIPFNGQAYGLCFSPDNSKLYVGSIYYLHQYDLLAANIPISISTFTTLQGADALQLATDGKIYVSASNFNYLGVINDPNIIGIGCNYVANALSLSFGFCSSGLPNDFIATQFPANPHSIMCGDTAMLNAGSGGNSYLWSTGDTTQSIAITQAGQYWVQVTTNCMMILTDTIKVLSILPNINYLPDTFFCKSC